MLPSTAFILSSLIWRNQEHLPHAFISNSISATSFPRAAPQHLRLRDDDDDDGNNQRITQDADNLLLPTSTLLLISASASICTLWSEYSVLTTGCGPRALSDALERGCYLTVLVVAGLSVFVRIVSGGQSLSEIYSNNTSESDMKYNLYVNLVENLSLLAVGGAFVALAAQSMNGEQMDGLSGINVEMCRAIQQSFVE